MGRREDRKKWKTRTVQLGLKCHFAKVPSHTWKLYLFANNCTQSWGVLEVALTSSSTAPLTVGVRRVSSNIGNRILEFILCMRHLRPKASYADSHTASVRATARTQVTVRDFPVKRRKQKVLSPQDISGAPASLTAQLCQVCPFYYSGLNSPSHFGCCLRSVFQRAL